MLILLDLCCVLQIWPHGDYPLIPVGKLVLNRNPVNYFAEVEQMAYDPSNMPPGIEPSPDKMLQVNRRFDLRSIGYFAACESFELTCPQVFYKWWLMVVCDQCFRDASSRIPTPTDTAWAPTTSRSLWTVPSEPGWPTTRGMGQWLFLTTKVVRKTAFNIMIL